MENKKYIRGKYSEGQKEATIKYLKNNYDELRGIRVKKGGKDIIKAHAESQGESVNKFVNRAIDEAIERDNMKGEVNNANNM